MDLFSFQGGSRNIKTLRALRGENGSETLNETALVRGARQDFATYISIFIRKGLFYERFFV